MMVQNGYNIAVNNMDRQMEVYTVKDSKPTYALEHLATFQVKNEIEIRNPKEKLKVLKDLDGSGAIWPQNMYMSFSGQWLVMLDNEMNEIENFPGSLIKEPTAFNSEDPMEVFNNILVFTVQGVSLGTTEMHFFQVAGVSAVSLVEDLKLLNTGNVVRVDRNPFSVEVPKPKKPFQAITTAGLSFEENALGNEKNIHGIQVLNHCFEDIERFVARLQYAAEALRELQLRHCEHSSHGEGLLILRSRPPIESEFHDILAKLKLAINYVVKLNNIFRNGQEPILNLFISLHTIVNICNDVHNGANIPKNVVNPLLYRETIQFLSGCLNETDINLWRSLGKNWSMAKEDFNDNRGSYHPIFYDDWCPDWVVDEEVRYVPLPNTKLTEVPQIILSTAVWLSRLESRNVKIAEVIHNRTSFNDKELTVVKGEYLEVIDDSRNWWKVRNSVSNIGYVPRTVLEPYNFEIQLNRYMRDTDSIATSIMENESFNANVRPDTIESDVAPPSSAGISMSRSYSMTNVPVPPPMPPPESDPPTPSETLKRNTAVTANQPVRARNGNEANDGLLMLQDSINEELRATLYQRERRKDLEILTTPNIYITQYSSPKEVEEWLRAKGFSDAIVAKFCKLNGEEMFTLSPHIIEGYFGQRESRRLVSQIILQKNICEYKTIRSSELTSKLAKARQKADQEAKKSTDIFYL